MNHGRSTIIRTLASRAALRIGLLLIVVACQLMAHGGFEHVIGTVVKALRNLIRIARALDIEPGQLFG